MMGISVTIIIHFVNKTPIEWYSKKQMTVEMSTYGYELSESRICVEKIIYLRTTFRYLEVPVTSVSHMFGDNKSVFNSSVKPY